MRPSYLKINLNNLTHNFNEIRRHCPNSKILAAVKANAYGHGLIECAKVLEKNRVDYFGVAFIEEGVELREAGIKSPIIALGGVAGRQLNMFIEYNVDIMASSVSKLIQIENTAKELGKTAKIHLKIDTGMERIGIHHYSSELETLIKKAVSSDVLDLVGISSHFAESESLDSSFTALQLKRFLDVVDRFSNILPDKIIRHISNSAALISSSSNHLDMVRPGRILYGISPSANLQGILNLKPCLELHSEVVYFKVVKKSESVSYNRNWYAKEDTRVVTIPVGYGDGIPRSLSNKGEVLIRGKRYPIIGSVCMDQFMVDLGPQGEAYNGDKVTLVGENEGQQITIEEIAQILGAEPLELLTHLNNRLPRVYTAH